MLQISVVTLKLIRMNVCCHSCNTPPPPPPVPPPQLVFYKAAEDTTANDQKLKQKLHTTDDNYHNIY